MKWDLTYLFETKEDFLASLAKMQEYVAKLASFKGKLHEEECFVERLDDILEILNSLTKENEKFSFIYNYSELVVRKEKEEVIFYKYLEDFSETLSQIVYQIGSRLFSIRKEVAEKWLEIFLEKDSKTYRNMGISFVERSLYVDVSIFEKHFLFLENISSDTELWKQLIPLYTCYISMNCKKKYEEDVKNHLKMLKEGTVEEKRICIQRYNKSES